ncbi:MAG: carbonate dehydratase [Pseudanabaena sp.]|nr:MAG: carbonate dehydratase [Pseudanabaena sp.]
MNLLNKSYFKNALLLLAIALATLIVITPPVLAATSPHWGYGGAENPTQWGKLSDDFLQCELGRDQSPIDIKKAVEDSPAKIKFDYKPTPLIVVNNGHTIQVNYSQGSTITINDEKYSLLQFHFHTPSEHNINSKASAMELHLVHRNEAGQLAVIGVMLNEGNLNPLIADIWKQIPDIGQTNTVSDRLINVTNLLPKNKAYFSYSGSLTTPPCSEGVSWNIFVEPITVSKEQIEAFSRIYQVDARPLQPINGRTVQLHR